MSTPSEKEDINDRLIRQIRHMDHGEDAFMVSLLCEASDEIERLRSALKAAYKMLGPSAFINPNG